jgi:hypothetical protein
MTGRLPGCLMRPDLDQAFIAYAKVVGDFVRNGRKSRMIF